MLLHLNILAPHPLWLTVIHVDTCQLPWGSLGANAWISINVMGRMQHQFVDSSPGFLLVTILTYLLSWEAPTVYVNVGTSIIWQMVMIPNRSFFLHHGNMNDVRWYLRGLTSTIGKANHFKHLQSSLDSHTLKMANRWWQQVALILTNEPILIIPFHWQCIAALTQT